MNNWLKGLIVLALLGIATTASALDFSNLSEGDKVCVDNFINSGAYVVQKDYNDYTVLVQLVSDKKQVWVKPVDLISSGYCQFENAVQKKIFEKILEGLQE